MNRASILTIATFLGACYGGTTAEGETDGAEGSSSGAASSTGVDASSASDGSTTGNSSTTDGDPTGDGSTGDSSDTDGDDEPTSDPLDGLPTGDEQWQLLCARGHGDAIAQAFCATNTRPPIGSITELLELIGLGFVPGEIGNAENGNPGVTMNYHSTAISTRTVNAINPRAFVFTPPVGGVVFPPSDTPDPNLTMMGFARGEMFVELVANDPIADELRFYLFRFNLPCEDSMDGCSNADLLTPSVESGFTDYSLYDDADISNTVLDCLQCHQPDGPGTLKMLRMQELEEGWHHWFYPNRQQNREAMTQFLDAHEGEDYGGIPAEMMTTDTLLNSGEGALRPVPFFLVMHNEGFGQGMQPNEYDSEGIRAERVNNGCVCNGCANPPPMDPTNSCSPTWDALYAASQSGSEIAAPYFDGHIADPAKITTAANAYKAVMGGQMSPDQMPDTTDVLWDGAEPYLSYAPAPGLDGRGILRHMCQHCHNSSLDQTISRADFNVETLDTLPQYIKDEAIQRLMLPSDDIDKMPPERFHQLSQAEINLVIEELSP